MLTYDVPVAVVQGHIIGGNVWPNVYCIHMQLDDRIQIALNDVEFYIDFANGLKTISCSLQSFEISIQSGVGNWCSITSSPYQAFHWDSK